MNGLGLNHFGVIMLALLMAPADKSTGGGNGKGETAPATPAHPMANNRFYRLFGGEDGIRFKAAKLTEKVYQSDDGSRQSKKLASVVLNLGGTGAFVEGKINGVSDNRGPVVPEFIFFAAQNRGQCIKADDPAASLELDEYRHWLCAQYIAWRKAQRTTMPQQAARQLETLTLDDVTL